MLLPIDDFPPTVDYVVRSYTFTCDHCQVRQANAVRFAMTDGGLWCQDCVGNLFGKEKVRSYLEGLYVLDIGDVVDGKRFIGFDGVLESHFVTEEVWNAKFTW